MFVIRRIQCKGLYRQYSSTLAESFYNEEQWELQKVTKKLIDNEINPFVDQWEDAKMFPAKEVFKTFGSAGLLGINKPTEYGGLGLDYKYQLAFLEACGYIRSGGVASNTGPFRHKHNNFEPEVVSFQWAWVCKPIVQLLLCLDLEAISSRRNS